MHLAGGPTAGSGSRLRSLPRSFSLPANLLIEPAVGETREAGVDAGRSDMATGQSSTNPTSLMSSCMGSDESSRPWLMLRFRALLYDRFLIGVVPSCMQGEGCYCY
jgi:hypothetical protein